MEVHIVLDPILILVIALWDPVQSMAFGPIIRLGPIAKVYAEPDNNFGTGPVRNLFMADTIIVLGTRAMSENVVFILVPCLNGHYGRIVAELVNLDLEPDGLYVTPSFVKASTPIPLKLNPVHHFNIAQSN